MYCQVTDCDSLRSGKSKYCRTHKQQAKAAWAAKVQAGYAERERLDTAFKAAFATARAAGLQAGTAHTPTPMHIVGYEPITEGVCGFAWIKILPGNCKAANYAKKYLGARAAYGGGVSLWVRDFNQSYERKRKYAEAFAEVLRELLPGIDPKARVYADGRLD